MRSKNIVITGSTRGIGLGLAREFIKQGCRVTIHGRYQTSVDQTLEELERDFGSENITGVPGDIVYLKSHQKLWAEAVATFGWVDIWINNAGIGQPLEMIWDLPEDKIHQLVDTNIKGLVFGSQTAARGFLEQGYGHIYNMEGFGSNGRKQNRLSIYGTTKAAVHYFSNALTEESKDTPIKVSTINPGMVITDMILNQFEQDPQALENNKKIFNTLADKVETVTPWLADQILHNDQTGAKIKWLTPMKLLYRFASAPFSKRDLFS
jgi:NAD(P)-dependent dehydrogenase (short-subunit alcohol dehydrogenase family)